MTLAHGNVIFDILEHSAFQKYSIYWVFWSLSCHYRFEQDESLTKMLHILKMPLNQSNIIGLPCKKSKYFN